MISPAGRRPSRRDSLTEWRLGPPETRLPSRKRGTLTQKGPMRCPAMSRTVHSAHRLRAAH